MITPLKSWSVILLSVASQLWVTGQVFSQPLRSIKVAPALVVGEHTLVSIEVGERETCFTFCLSDPDRDVSEFRQFGTEFVFTAPPGRYVVLVYGGERPRPPTRVEIRKGITPVPPGPDPLPPNPVPPEPTPPEPTPLPTPIRPEGLAGEIFDRVFPLTTPTTKSAAQTIAQCFTQVAKGIENARVWQSAETQAERDKVPAPKYFQTNAAADACVKAIIGSGVETEPFNAALAHTYAALNAVKMSLDKTKEVMEAAAKGFSAAGKR